MRNKDDKCQIEIRKETRVKLKELRICNRESYDEVIGRLLNLIE